jgi:acetyltransferase
MIVRPIVAGDEKAYRAILEDTTAEDRYCRFFHLVDHFDPEELQRFVEPRSDTIGMIAFDGETPLGTAHAILLDDTATEAELAIVVARGARRSGVGTSLIEALVARLRERGVRRVFACALRENRPLENLARRTGFHVDQTDGPAWRFVLDLAPDSEPPQA